MPYHILAEIIESFFSHWEFWVIMILKHHKESHLLTLFNFYNLYETWSALGFEPLVAHSHNIYYERWSNSYGEMQSYVLKWLRLH